jgi:SAM-dependent methyltransferase
MLSRAYGPELSLVYERRWGDFARRAGPALGRMLHALGVRSGRVVDLGCGTGHVAVALSRRGLSVLGVDCSRSIVAEARRRAPKARFRVGRLETLALPRGAAAVVSTFDALNYVLKPEVLGQVFRGIARCLRPGGVFVFDLSTPLSLRRRQAEVQVRRTKGLFLVLEGTWDEAEQLGRLRLTGFQRAGDGFRRFEEVHVQRGYTEGEVEDLLTRSGLRHERLAGYWESPDVLSEERLFYLARPA